MAEFLIPVIQSAQDLVKWVLDNKDAIVVALGAIATGILAFNMVTMIQGMVQAFQAWRAATEGMTIAQAALNLIMNANPIALIITLVAGLVSALILAWNNCDGFREGVTNAFTKVKEVITNVVGTIVGFFTETIPNVFNSIVEFFKNNWQEILTFMANPFAGIVAFIYKLNPQFKEWVDNLLGKIKEWFGKVKDVGKYIVEGIWNGISNATDWIKNKISEWVGNVTSFLKKLLALNHHRN